MNDNVWYLSLGVKIMINPFIYLLAACTLVGCKPRGALSSWQDSEATWDDMKEAVKELKPYDLSILLPPAGVPQAQTENSQALPFLQALFDIKLTYDKGLVPKTRYSEMHETPVRVWGESKSMDRLQSWIELGFWPKLFSGSMDLEHSGVLEPDDARQLFPLVFPEGNPLKPSPQGSPWVIPAWQWTRDAPRPQFSAPNEGEVPLGRGLPDGFREVSVSINEAERWRVVSMRLDLCRNSYQHFWKDQQWNFDLALVSKWCHPEIRFVAQPMIGNNAIESAIGRELPDVSIQTRIARAGDDGFKKFSSIEKDPVHSGGYFADYAIHVFHKIDLNIAKQMLAQITELKMRHKDLCDSSLAGLRIHPCLVRSYLSLANQDALLKALEPQKADRNAVALTSRFSDEIAKRHSQWSQITFARDIFEIFRKFAGRPDRVAFFASTASQDPWIFHLLEWRQGQWKRSSIPAFKRGSSAEFVGEIRLTG